MDCRWNRTSLADTLLPRSTGTSPDGVSAWIRRVRSAQVSRALERLCRQASPTRVEGERRMARIELQDVSKVYAGGVRAVNALSLDIPDGDAMVFQNYALYPHMTVEDNLAFGLQLRKTPKDEQKKRVTEAAKMLALEPFLKRKPAALSGGQRQRVAM